ncbi:MAG: Gfo/Idh/MocA family oxidoreductase [Cyclobacteriaceae bacterium]|nr:Gfo/Idh/MocA family oxidoreductase [Cyclobacteriaceae bacterium]
MTKTREIKRRNFIKKVSAVSMGITLQVPSHHFSGKKKNSTVRIGIIGTGNRGSHLLKLLMGIQDVEIVSLCDINQMNLDNAVNICVNAGRKRPDGYFKDEYSYKELLDREDIDAVIIATYWESHTPIALYAMEQGKYPGVEVPAAITLEQCWDLVNTSEKTGIPCMMLENWSFRKDNLAVLNMIRKGLLGDMVHCHCAHSHDCIDHWFFDANDGSQRWAAKYLINYNRDQYPTHSLGPVLSWMDINCGDTIAEIYSVSTASRGINAYMKRKFGVDHPNARQVFKQGDIVTSTLKTKQGKTIIINYDMQLPRPYDNRWMVQGTLGIYNEQRGSVYLTGKSPEYHEWEPFPPYEEKYLHRWWKNTINSSEGHGGVDMLELKLFVDAVRNKTNTPVDVYDSVTMSAVVPLSGLSIEKNQPVDFPDFTRGKWEGRKPYFAL